MAKLILSMNGKVQGEYELSQESMTIGRKPDNSIHIDNLAVSSKHALITTILEDSFLEDLGSTNGTYVNGKLIKKQALRNGDIVALGQYELKYINEEVTAPSEDDAKTMIITPRSAADAEAVVRAAEKAGAWSNTGGDAMVKPPGAIAKLMVLSGPLAGKELELSKALVTLGKPGTQVAVISRRTQGYFLTHIESDGDGKRYPTVNGEAIGQKKYHLEDGDIVELASIKMEFRLNSAAP